MEHDNIWSAIDRLAAGHGYSPSGLAKQAGLDATSFNRSKRTGPDGKPRWPSTESLSKILSVTGATMSEFIALMDPDAESVTPQPRDIPVLGFAQAGSKGYFDEDGYPVGEGWDRIRFPETGKKESAHIYALEVSGDSMEPVYRAGDRLICSPAAPVRRGDRVVVRTRKGEVLAKELARQTAGRLELKSLNPAHENRTFKTDEVSWMARILWVSQ